MIAKIKQFVKEKAGDLTLFLLVFLAVFLLFGVGNLVYLYWQKSPLIIESPAWP